LPAAEYSVCVCLTADERVLMSDLNGLACRPRVNRIAESLCDFRYVSVKPMWTNLCGQTTAFTIP
jgi:hypothetical protein